MTTFIGIDPGTLKTGWAVITTDNGKLEVVESGVLIAPRSVRLETRLFFMHERVGEIIKYWPQSRVGIEEPFLNKNPKVTIVLAKVHAACLLGAGNAMDDNSKVYTYAPAQVKKAVGCKGNATKAQVQDMVAALYGLHIPLPEDESDAVAVATCLEQEVRVGMLMAENHMGPSK